TKGSDTHLFGSNNTTLVNGDPIVSTSTPYTEAFNYESGTGADQFKTPDLLSCTYTNTRAASAPLTINKVWRDAGTTANRPDIRLNLYRCKVGGTQ
ncbi:MAG: hypothetical protein RSD95_17470, partial [Clostridia bacterium]